MVLAMLDEGGKSRRPFDHAFHTRLKAELPEPLADRSTSPASARPPKSASAYARYPGLRKRKESDRLLR